MRIAFLISAVLLLLLLLTWLSFRAINADAELFDRALGALDHFEMVENALQRDVLRARVGQLRNYDPLVRETDQVDRSVLKLRETAALDAEAAGTLDRLAASIVSQETLIEQFKSNNALLQNSLAYFERYSFSLGGSDRTRPAVPAVSGLVATMLHLTFDTSPATAQEVENWLNELAAQPPPLGQAAAIQALLAHGRLLHQLLPAIDGLSKEIRAVPLGRDGVALRTKILTRQAGSRAIARNFRLLLYFTSVLLVALLLYLGMQLRARALALYRRAAFEHLIAGISTRLIDIPTKSLGSHVARALAELAECVGADRAYLMSLVTAAPRHAWCRDGVAFPLSWPDRAPELAARVRPSAEDIIYIPHVGRLASGEDKDILVAAGLHGWVCVPEPGEAGGSFILGFDAVRPGHILKSKELGLLRMARDAVANAVRRDALEQDGFRLEKRLQQGRRMETVGALASGIAHNFNNIVAAILGYAEMAEARVEADSQPARDIAEIRRAGERAQDLVEQILAFGRQRSARRELVCVRDLLAEVRSLLQASLPSGIDLMFHDASGSAVIVGERGQLQQVLLNLCNNAAQAMDGSGRVELEARIHDVARVRPLSHGDLAPGRYVCIAVSDSGLGIDTVTLSQIFELFFTTRPEGNGLGLATVHDIVGEHGGMMHVQSAPQAGSRFEAWLPCAPTDAPPLIETVPAAPFGSGETVLVVDEEREQLLRNEEILAALGYEPVGFVRSTGALRACREAPKRFDVLLVGHHGPAATTLELAADLHAIVPNVPIVLAAAWAKEVTADELMAVGVSDVVHWPIIATEMAAALAGCSATRRSEETTSGRPEHGSAS